MKGLVLAGGSGTRLRPLTHTGPKQLIPIANKPVLFYGLEDLKEAGIDDVGIVLGLNMPERIKEAVGDGSVLGIRTTYIEQGMPKGLAHAVLISEEFMEGESFVMYLGDNILRAGVKDLVEGFEASDHDARILLAKVKNPQRFGVAELDKRGRVVGLEEKPKRRNELEITDAIQRLIDNGYRVDSHIVNGWWKDTGKPEDILDANRLVLDDLKSYNKGVVEEGVEIHGRVAIGEGTVIKEGSVLKGPSIIGKKCTIGPESYVGAYTSIGDNTFLEETEIEDSIVIGDAKIKTRVKIVESLIGRESKIISEEKTLPRGWKLIIGEHSDLRL